MSDFHKQLVTIWLFVLLLAAGWGATFAAYLNLNLGHILLNHALAGGEQPSLIVSGVLEQAASMNTKARGAAWRALGYIHAHNHNENEANTMWQMAHNHVNMVIELVSWGKANEKEGDLDAALKWYERAIAVDPGNADSWYWAAQVLELEGDTARAIHYYETGLQTSQFHDVGLSDITLRLGTIAFAKMEWIEARHWFDMTIEKSDFRVANRAWEAHYLRAEIWRLLDESEFALLDYEETIKLSPNHYWSYIYLANIVWQLQNDAVKAENLLTYAISIDPARKWAYRYLGNLYYNTNQVEKAIPMYHSVLAIDPTDEQAQQYLDQLLNITD